MIRRSLLGEFSIFEREVTRLMEGLAGRQMAFLQSTHSLWEPSTDVCESEDAIHVTMELPGVAEDRLDVTLGRDWLTVRGVRERQGPEGAHSCHLMEINYGPFERTVRLPAEVEEDETTVALESGFLKIKLVKVPVPHPRRIPVVTIE